MPLNTDKVEAQASASNISPFASLPVNTQAQAQGQLSEKKVNVVNPFTSLTCVPKFDTAQPFVFGKEDKISIQGVAVDYKKSKTECDEALEAFMIIHQRIRLMYEVSHSKREMFKNKTNYNLIMSSLKKSYEAMLRQRSFLRAHPDILLRCDDLDEWLMDMIPFIEGEKANDLFHFVRSDKKKDVYKEEKQECLKLFKLVKQECSQLPPLSTPIPMTSITNLTFKA